MVRATRRWLTAAAAIAAVAISGCELGTTSIARTVPDIVIHSVLNPSSRIQVVIVEESLTGAVNVDDDDHGYDPSNPVVTGGGIAVTGALVQLVGPDSVVMTGAEYKPNNASTGIYQILLDNYLTGGAPENIQRGKRYQLTVTAHGKIIRGSTVVPAASPASFAPVVAFNRDHQSVAINAGNAALTRAYWVRIEAPLNSYSSFSVDPHINIPGDARNLFTDDLVPLFYPGILQTVTVAAIDTNTYDYYRSGNDPFSGSGLITHLTGGLGLFGSMVRVTQEQLDVTQDFSGDSIEDLFTLRGGTAPQAALAFSMRLFLEAKGTNGALDQLSGSYLRGNNPPRSRGGVIGTRDGDIVALQLMLTSSTSRTIARFLGTIRGDSIVGTFKDTDGMAVYVRSGK